MAGNIPDHIANAHHHLVANQFAAVTTVTGLWNVSQRSQSTGRRDARGFDIAAAIRDCHRLAPLAPPATEYQYWGPVKRTVLVFRQKAGAASFVRTYFPLPARSVKTGRSDPVSIDSGRNADGPSTRIVAAGIAEPLTSETLPRMGRVGRTEAQNNRTHNGCSERASCPPQ